VSAKHFAGIPRNTHDGEAMLTAYSNLGLRHYGHRVNCRRIQEEVNLKRIDLANGKDFIGAYFPVLWKGGALGSPSYGPAILRSET